MVLWQRPLPACLDVRHEEGKLGLELVQAVRHHGLLVRLALWVGDGSKAQQMCGEGRKELG